MNDAFRIAGVILLTLSISICGAGIVSAEASVTTLMAAAGRSDIEIPSNLYPVDGFVGQHDPLIARVLLLDDGSKRIGIIVVDETSISDGSIADKKAILNKVAGVPPGNAVVCADTSDTRLARAQARTSARM
jgi:neutral ceramidase